MTDGSVTTGPEKGSQEAEEQEEVDCGAIRKYRGVRSVLIDVLVRENGAAPFTFSRETWSCTRPWGRDISEQGSERTETAWARAHSCRNTSPDRQD